MVNPDGLFEHKQDFNHILSRLTEKNILLPHFLAYRIDVKPSMGVYKNENVHKCFACRWQFPV
jgi:hypothetical protein